VLGFDESFFAKLSAISGAIALAGVLCPIKHKTARNLL
jgi:hypothetical protein